MWIDQDIPTGANWDESVERALQESSKVLLVMSPAAVASNNVLDERSYFLGMGRAVNPFIYQLCELPFRLRRQYGATTGDVLRMWRECSTSCPSALRK